MFYPGHGKGFQRRLVATAGHVRKLWHSQNSVIGSLVSKAKNVTTVPPNPSDLLKL